MSNIELASHIITIIVGLVPFAFFLVLFLSWLWLKFYIYCVNKYIKNHHYVNQIKAYYQEFFKMNSIKKANEISENNPKIKSIELFQNLEKTNPFHVFFQIKIIMKKAIKYSLKTTGKEYQFCSQNSKKEQKNKRNIKKQWNCFKKQYFDNFEVMQKSYSTSLDILSYYSNNIEQKIKNNEIRNFEFRLLENPEIYNNFIVLYIFGVNGQEMNYILINTTNGSLVFKNSINIQINNYNLQIKDGRNSNLVNYEFKLIKNAVEIINEEIIKSWNPNFILDFSGRYQNKQIYKVFDISVCFVSYEELNSKIFKNGDSFNDGYVYYFKSHYDDLLGRNMVETMGKNDYIIKEKNKNTKFLFNKEEITKIENWAVKLQTCFENANNYKWEIDN